MEAASKEYGQKQNKEKEPCKKKPKVSVWEAMCILHLGHTQTAGVWQKDGIFKRKKGTASKAHWQLGFFVMSPMPGYPHQDLPFQIQVKGEGWEKSQSSSCSSLRD